MVVAIILGSITLGVLPSIAWLVFFLNEDADHEPRKAIALTFTLGIAFAFLALFAENLIQSIFALGDIDFASLFASSPAHTAFQFGMIVFALFLLAGTEEIAKFLAAVIAVRNNPDFDIPVDTMIYMVTAALGFALVENLGVLGGIAGQSASLAEMLGTISFRFVGATLLHALSSSIVGYYWAESIRAFGRKRILALGIFLAASLHTVFNYLILNYGAGSYSILFLLVLGFFVIGDFERLKGERV